MVFIVVNALWTGDLIQKNNENHDIDCTHIYLLLFFIKMYLTADVAYADTREHSFWGHFDPARLSVPRFVVRKFIDMSIF